MLTCMIYLLILCEFVKEVGDSKLITRVSPIITKS